MTVFKSSSRTFLSSGWSAWYSWSRYLGLPNKLQNTLSFTVRFASVFFISLFSSPICCLSLLSFLLFLFHPYLNTKPSDKPYALWIKVMDLLKKRWITAEKAVISPSSASVCAPYPPLPSASQASRPAFQSPPVFGAAFSKRMPCLFSFCSYFYSRQ